MVNDILFIFSATLIVVCSIGVAFSKKLINSCIALLLTFLGVAGLYVTLGAEFLAATQLVVYAGGVVVLLLFAIMLSGGVDDDANKLGLKKIALMGNWKSYSLAIFVVAIISLTLVQMIINITKLEPGIALPNYESSVEKIGRLLVTNHVIAFEISSILLLGALIGAATIARPRILKKEYNQ